MITHEDQMNLFRIISKSIKKDIECYAFGGTAMMFYGYKDETKDVDLLFNDEPSRKEFIEAIKQLGFNETSLLKIYIPEKLRDKNRPLMFKREDYRFDLFVKQIFKTKVSPRMKEDLFAIHEFKEKSTLKIGVFRKECIVQLKAITERQNDFDDILTILKKEQNFDWQYLIDETIWQHRHGDSWAILDMEKMIRQLKEYHFVEQKYLEQLYKAQKEK